MKRQYWRREIEFFMGMVHIGTSNMQVAKMIFRRTKEWPKEQRKMAVRDALEAHKHNRRMYYKVMGGI